MEPSSIAMETFHEPKGKTSRQRQNSLFGWQSLPASLLEMGFCSPANFVFPRKLSLWKVEAFSGVEIKPNPELSKSLTQQVHVPPLRF